MLVLSRKKDECIVINNDITIVVVEIRGDKVRLGVEAPKEVPVHRREVYEAILRGDDVAHEAPPTDGGITITTSGTLASPSGEAVSPSGPAAPSSGAEPVTDS